MNVLDQFRLDGRQALVTGGARGLGRVMAEALAQAGASIAITSRNAEAGEAAAREIAAASGREVRAYVVDVTSGPQILALASDVEAGFGAVDILVNNAGINVRGACDQLSEADWDAVVDTNLKGPFLCARTFGPRMAGRGWGRIINMGSILSVIGIAGRAPYASSKAGVANLTRVLALEWAEHGVTVNAICPGPFGTDMNRPLMNDPEKFKAFLARIPMGRWGELHEIAGVAVFLASDASSFVTGTSVFVDGGWTAQ